MSHPERLAETPETTEIDAATHAVTVESNVAETVEAVLGVPLTGRDAPLAVHDTDVRAHAARAVLEALAVPADEAHPNHPAIEPVSQLAAMRRLALQLQTANDLLAYGQRVPSAGGGDARSAFQATALRRIIDHAQRAPSSPTPTDHYRDGYLTMAPPGAGKSVLQAHLIAGSGIGLPVSERDPRLRTGIGIVGSRWLLQQQLDPDATLRRFLAASGRDVPVGAYYSGRKDGHDEYPLLLTTYQSYKKGVQQGAIKHDTTNIILLDEAHEAGHAPSMQSELPHFGSDLFMFTATPAIAGGRRDLRHRFPHSQFGSIVEFIRDGILSPVQLFTYRAGPDPVSAEHIAARLAGDYIASGRKTIVVCQPGEKQAQARRVAALINQSYTDKAFQPHERFGWLDDQPAQAIGTYNASMVDTEFQNLRANKRLALTTVDTGRNGLDIPDLDAVILIGPQGAAWNVEQWVGRVLRHSGRLAVAAEILPHTIPEKRPVVSIFGRFGLERERIIAGYYVGPISDESSEPEPGEPVLSSPPLSLARPPTSPSGSADSEPEALPFELEPHASRSPQPLATHGAELQSVHSQAIPSYLEGCTPPADLIDALIHDVPVRQVTLAPADYAKLPPEGYAPLDDILPDGVPIQWLYNMLDRLDDPHITYVGFTDWQAEGEHRYSRYYSPATRAYLAGHTLPDLLREGEYSAVQLADMLDVPRKFVNRFLADSGFEPVARATPGIGHTNKVRYFRHEAMIKLSEAVKSIPRAIETDVPVSDLSMQLSADYVVSFLANPANGVDAIDKWRHPVWGVRGATRHLTAEEAERIRTSYYAVRVADTDQMMNYTDIARHAGVSISQAFSRLNEADPELLPPVSWQRSGPSCRPSMHVDRRWGEAFADYIAPERVLPWEVTIRGVAVYFGKTPMASRFAVERRIARGLLAPPVLHAIPGASSTSLYDIAVLSILEAEGHQRAEHIPQFQPSKAVMMPADRHSADRLAYSLQFQASLMAKQQLVTPEALERYWQRRQTPPGMPNPHDYVAVDVASKPGPLADHPLATTFDPALHHVRDDAIPADWLPMGGLAAAVGEGEQDIHSLIQGMIEVRGYPLQEGEASFFAESARAMPTPYFSPRMVLLVRRYLRGST